MSLPCTLVFEPCCRFMQTPRILGCSSTHGSLLQSALIAHHRASLPTRSSCAGVLQVRSTPGSSLLRTYNFTPLMSWMATCFPLSVSFSVSISLSLELFLSLSLYLSVCPSVCLSVCLSLYHLCLSLSFSLSSPFPTLSLEYQD